MYRQIHQSVTSTNCRPCKTSLAASWAARANITILRPFVKSSIGSRWQTSYITVALQWLKCMTGHAPGYLSSKFLKQGKVSGRSTRNSQLLNIPFFLKTASSQRMFYYRIVSLWNSLDCSLKWCKSVSVFKNRLKNQTTWRIVIFFYFYSFIILTTVF